MPTSPIIAEHELADRFTEAISRADIATLRDLYTDDAVIWHCTDSIELSVDDLAQQLAAINSVSSCSIEVLSRQLTITGFVQTQVNTYSLHTGEDVTLRAALIVTEDEGRVRRVDEYLDGEALGPLVAALKQ
ncbi:nuclear transport factor 2 family protein [Gordonia terrae]